MCHCFIVLCISVGIGFPAVSLRTRAFILPRELSAKFLILFSIIPSSLFSSFCPSPQTPLQFSGSRVRYFVSSVSSDLLPWFFSSVCSFILWLFPSGIYSFCFVGDLVELSVCVLIHCFWVFTALVIQYLSVFHQRVIVLWLLVFLKNSNIQKICNTWQALSSN